MKLKSFSSFGCWSLLVLWILFVVAKADVHQDDEDDDEWINPFDMLNYDPTTKRMRKSTESSTSTNVPTKRREFTTDSNTNSNTDSDVPQCPDVAEYIRKLDDLQKEVDEHNKRGTSTSQQPTCANAVFKRFLSKLLKETAKIGLPNDANTDMHYDAEVKLSKQTVAEVKKLVKDDNSWTTGAMDEALSQILINFKLHDHEAWKWRFEDTFHVEADTIFKIFLCVLIIMAIICTEMWSVVSWFVQFRRMFAVCFFISMIWNWFHLYMLAFAEHHKNIVQMESFNGKCTGVKEINWKDSLAEWYRRTWTLQDDPCKKYYEVLLVNPILLVPPTKAITVTITSFITDPLKQIGQGISEFLTALLKDMPVTLQLPVLIIIVLAVLVFVYGGTQAAIQHAVPWPRLGRRQDPPPPAIDQRRVPQLEADENAWGRGDAPLPLQVHRQGDGINQIRNRVNQGTRAGDGQEGNRANSMEIPDLLFARARETQTVRVETLRSGTGNSCSEDTPDSQQRTQEKEPGTEEGVEPQAAEVPKEDNPSRVDKSKPKDSETPDKSEEPAGSGPAQQTDVTTIGANQGNDHFLCTKRMWAAQNDLMTQVVLYCCKNSIVQRTSTDFEPASPENEENVSFKTPVQETGP